MPYQAAETTLHLFCEGCGVQAETRVLTEHLLMDSGQVLSAEGLDPVHYTQYAFSICKKCGSPFFTKQAFLEVPEADVTAPQEDPVVLFPSARGIPEEAVPSKVAKAYGDAAVAFRAGLPVPCAIMCRKAVEALCHELGATGKTLFDRLADLQERRVIDAKLLSWADGLRLVGNDAAHDLDVTVSQQDASDALEFTQALCVYVFSLTRRFDEFHKRRSPNVQ